MQPSLRLAAACFAFVSASAAPAQAEEPSASAASGQPAAAGKAEHVVVIVWDGLRPDSVTDETTPTLAKLAREGVTFTRHHSVYPTSTEVNGTALATGMYPGHSGIIGNLEYRPDIDPLKAVATEKLETIRKGDEVSGGHYLAVPTLPEMLQQSGERTVVAGTKPVVLLQDRSERHENLASERSVNLVAGAARPVAGLETLVQTIGDFPKTTTFPNVAADAWTVKALTGTLWKEGLPNYSLLWLSDPDYTQHQTGVGSPAALGALKSSDDNLAAVLTALEAGGWRDKTDIFIVSDHGFSTIARPLNVAATLVEAGFSAAREYKQPPKRGDILVDSLGGSVYFYVAEHDPETTRRLVEYLQSSDFAGVLFTRQALPGTFPLDAVRINSPNAPDVAMALRWSHEQNKAGVAGLTPSDGTRKAGQGTHASLSPYDTHNTLIAAGPDLQPGLKDELPSSNADVAPTIAQILGVKPEQPMDGRVLWEAMADRPEAARVPKPRDERMEAVRETDHARWRQFLHVTRCDGAIYFNEGNGAPEQK